MIQSLEPLKSVLVRIENLAQYKVQIPKYHPDAPEYRKLWTKYTKLCIDGLWGTESMGYRFMPPTLFFYGNFCSIETTDNETKTSFQIRPDIRDIDWMIHYEYMVAQGFSGFKDDDEFTCDKRVIGIHNPSEITNLNLITSKGTIKKYVDPIKYLYGLHKNKLGTALYANEARNMMLFGARSTGKSYSVAGIATHILTFDGKKNFVTEWETNTSAQVCIGAGDSTKSSELCNKIENCLNMFGEEELGAFGDKIFDIESYIPNAFYRDWRGSLDVGNKKNPYRCSYDIQIGKRWHKEQGSKTNLVHVSYSDKKQGGEAAAAGGRYALSVCEEVGLMPNARDVILSNNGVVKRNGLQFGVQVALGTSGNIDLVQQSKKLFNSPEEYNFVSHEDVWENNGRIGLFLPAYISDKQFKDIDGNTNVEKAISYYESRRKEAALKTDSEIFRYEQMNFPIVPSDMWVSIKGAYFPITELLAREKVLVHNNDYRALGVATKLLWASNVDYGVRAEQDPNAEPFFEFPFDRAMTKKDGAIMIYEEPQKINGEIPKDLYFFTLDPYISENVDEGGSLGAFYGYYSPKYSAQGYQPGKIVCSYIGKHPEGTNSYYENVEKIIAYYGSNPRSLWYEANRGDSVRGYFIRKNKINLLAPRPNKEVGSSMYERRVTEYGILIDTVAKFNCITDTYDLLLSEFNGKRYYESLPDIFLLRQMLNFEIKKHKNFDAVSSFIMASLVLKEMAHTIEHEASKRVKHNPLSFLSVNPNVFKNANQSRSGKSYYGDQQSS